MMKVSKVSEILFEAIEPSIRKYGFKLNKTKREFKRKVGDVTQIFDLFFYKKRDYISIKPEVRIKVKPIEDVYRSISMLGRPYFTLGNHLFEILRYVDRGEEIGKGAKNNWLLENEQDIQKLIQVIPEYFEETILPYFEENSSIKRVDELLNKYPRDLSVHNWLYPLRVNVAIIAAKLNGNENLSKLINIYEEELIEAEETYKEEFYKLKKLLSN